MTERDDDFLARWSRRKNEARKGLHKTGGPAEDGSDEEQVSSAALADEGQVPNVEPGDDAASPAVPADDEPPGDAVEDDFSDVDFDALGYDSDYGRFMKEGVPDAIRRRALKQLYRSNPILANVDGLNDYDDDFTDAALAVKVLESAWKVGRGYLTDEDLAEMEDDAGELDADAPAEVDVAEAEAGKATASETGTNNVEQSDTAEDGGASDDEATSETTDNGRANTSDHR